MIWTGRIRPTPFKKGVGSPKLIWQKRRLNASVFANKRSKCYATSTNKQIRYCRICGRRVKPFFFFLFPSGFSCFFFCERRNKRNETKNPNANDIKNPLLWRGVAITLRRRGVSFTNSDKDYRNLKHAFSLSAKGAKKKLSKKKRRKGRFAVCGRRGGLRDLHRANPL